MTGDSVVLQWMLLRIIGKTAVRNANHSDDNGLAAKYLWDVLLIKEIFPPVSLYLTDSLLLLSILSDLSAEIWLSTSSKSKLSNMYERPHILEKVPLKYVSLAETGPPTHALF